MKQQLIMEQYNETELKLDKIKEKIQQLKEDYLYETYKLLKQIFDIRKKQFPRYSLGDLSKEQGLDFKYWFLKYLFKLDHASERSRELIENKIVKPTTIMRIIHQNQKFRNHEIQDRVVQDILDGKINVHKIFNMSGRAVLEYIREKGKPIAEDQIALLQTTYLLNSCYNHLVDNANILKIPKYKKKFVENFNRLQNLVGIKFGIRMVCPKCEHRIKLNEWKKHNEEKKE